MSSSSPSQNQQILSLPSTEPQPIKKSQPIPWSHQETLALIQSYQQKWYSLNKGQLKAFQWEQVVSSVAQLCGLQIPSKTSTQCRHKIEKLRKRYRQEIQKPFPDSWQYFQLMDQMERGPNAPPVNYSRINTIMPVVTNNNVVIGSGSNRSNNAVPPRFFISGSSNNSRVVVESDESDEEWNVGLDGIGSGSSNKRSKLKSINNIVRNRGAANNRVVDDDRFVGVLRDRKRKEFYNGGYSSEEAEEEEDYLVDDVVAEEKYEDVVEEEGGNVGKELAGEIRRFAENFVRMEKGKIEMMREKERQRMEMEKKRTEMILGAQRRIVETIGRAFGTDKKPRMG